MPASTRVIDRIIRSALILAGACAAGAQSSVEIEFDRQGERLVWTSTSLPDREPENPIRAMTARVRIDGKELGAGAKIFVVESETGNLAFVSARDATRGWRPRPEEFRYAFRVQVRLEHHGRPVAAAAVTLQDRERAQTAVLSPSDEGRLTFYAVRHGPLKITARYSSDGHSKTTPTQLVELEPKREAATAEFAIAIVDRVETTSPARKTAADQRPPQRKPRDAGSILGQVVAYVVAATIGVGALVLVFRLLQRHPARTEAVLKRLGVQIEEPVAVANESSSVAPRPSGPIILAPDASRTASDARLVSEIGEVLAIPAGATEIGREAALRIADGSVSRRHAVVTRNEEGVRIRDLGSTNGTYVNGVRISEEVALAPGDLIQFGTCRYRFES